MDFYDPVNDQTPKKTAPEVAGTSDINAATEEAVQRLETDINQAYSVVESLFSTLWLSASKNAATLQEKYHLDEKRKQLMEQLNQAKNNINSHENVRHIEAQLKDLTNHVQTLNLGSITAQANNALDSLDAQLENVEKQAGKYVSSFASFFTSMVSVEPEKKQSETLFTLPLAASEEYGTSRYGKDLHELHSSAKNYTEGEENDEFLVDAHTDEISALLQQYPVLKNTMNDLVPVQVPYKTFWARYFAADAKLKTAELQRKALLEQEKKPLLDKLDDSKETEDEEFNWDDDEDEEAAS